MQPKSARARPRYVVHQHTNLMDCDRDGGTLITGGCQEEPRCREYVSILQDDFEASPRAASARRPR